MCHLLMLTQSICTAFSITFRAHWTRRIYRFTQYVRETVVACHQGVVQFAIAVFGHRTAHKTISLLHHYREMPVNGSSQRSAVRSDHRHIGVLVLLKPHVNHFTDRIPVVQKAFGFAPISKILAGTRKRGGGPAIIVVHDAAANIETGHIGQIRIPFLFNGCGN